MFSFSDIDSKKPPKNGITYHFPELHSSKLSSAGKIEYSMVGKENEPNVTYTTLLEKTKRSYVSNKLSIFSKTHDKYTEVKGELVVENIPITGTGKKLFLCFPIITDAKIQPNIIDTLIVKNTEDEPIPEIKLDDVLPSESDCILYETAQGIFVTFQTPVYVQTSIQLLYRNIPEDGIATQKEQIHATKQSTWATSLFSSLMESPDKPTKEGLDVLHTSNYSPPANIVEGLQDMDRNEDFQWMECQTADLDYSDNVPNMITTTSSNLTNAEQGFLIATIVLYMIIIVGVLCLIGFYLYSKNKVETGPVSGGGGAGTYTIIETLRKSIANGKDFTNCDGPFSMIVIIFSLLLFIWVIIICSYFIITALFHEELKKYLGKTQLYGFTAASLIVAAIIIVCSYRVLLQITKKK